MPGPEEIERLTFYALRYDDSVALRDRKHGPTRGRFDTFGAAADALDAAPNPGLLQIVERTVPAPTVVREVR